MGNIISPDRWRHGAQVADRIAALIPGLRFQEEHIRRAIASVDVPANATHDTIMRVYMALDIIQLLILGMGSQDVDPRFQFMFALIVLALGLVKCSLLMYILLGDMPWLTLLLCIPMLLMLFAFIAN